MATVKGKIITGHIARLTFLDSRAQAAGIRKSIEQRFIMYVFRDPVHLKAAVKGAMDEARKAGTPVELTVYKAAVTIGDRVDPENPRAGEAQLADAIKELNRAP